MEKKSRVGIGMMMIGMALVLIVLPSFQKETLAQPKPEGTLRAAWPTLAQEGFLPDYGDTDQNVNWCLVYDFPFFKNEKTRENIPGLALGGEYSKDASSYTMHLRKGVPWQDTKKWGEVTAEDVKYTYERIMRRTSTASLQPTLEEAIKSMELIDRYTLKINFKNPFPEFHMVASQKHGPIVCKKYVETVGDEKARWEPIGSGPWRLVEHKFGQYLKFEAADKNWRLVPEFKYIYQYIVPEESTRIAMLKTKQLDLAQISPSQMADVEKTPFLKVKLRPGGYNIFSVFGGMETPKDSRYKEGYHLKDPWAKNIKVREAMNIAIDRNAIIKAVYLGAAVQTSVCHMLPGWQDLPPIPYDPERARRLLAEAGYPNGFDLTVVASSGWKPANELPKVMEILANYWEAIGLKPKIVPMDKGEQTTLFNAGKMAGKVFGYKDSYRDAWGGKLQQYFSYVAKGVYFQDPELITALNDYEQEVDLAKRTAKLAKVRDWTYKHWITIPLIQSFTEWAYNREVVGYWPDEMAQAYERMDYIRHPKPVNTFRLFEIE